MIMLTVLLILKTMCLHFRITFNRCIIDNQLLHTYISKSLCGCFELILLSCFAEQAAEAESNR